MNPKKIDEYIELFISYGIKLTLAIIIIIAGFWFANHLTKIVRKIFIKREVEISLSTFLTSFLNILMKILVVVVSIASVGVDMTSIAAVLGAGSLAVGMALSGTLQNFAGGTVILLLKPFKVGDTIEAQGFIGVVNEVAIFTTRLLTFDNKTIFIPNGSLANGSIINYTREGSRRIEAVFNLAYGEDMDVARKIILNQIRADKRIFTDPEPLVVVSSLAPSTVNMTVRVWASAIDFAQVGFDLNESVYKAIPAAGLHFPFPQMDVHIKSNVNSGS